MKDKILTFVDTHSGETIKAFVTVILFATAVLLTVVSLRAGIEIVFTHFYYIPIIVSAYWYRLRGIIFTIALSVFYLGVVMLFTIHDPPTLIAAAGRIVMFIGIAGVVAVLSEVIHRQKAALYEKNRHLAESNARLAATEEELRKNLEQLAESERNLLVSREQIRLILDSSAEGICGIDREGCLSFVNHAGLRLLGYGSPLDILGKDIHELLHHSHADCSKSPYDECHIRHAHRDGATTSCDNDVFWKKDGTSFPVSYCSAPLIRNGAIDGAVLSFQNITERIKMMDKIEGSLREKEILLREIHHRVKNNLQIVASLLNLQSRYIRDEKVLDAIRESQNRVRAMALVHERLYRSGDLSRIDSGDYVRFLMTNLFKFYDVKPQKITQSVSLEGVTLDINSAIPVGLIVNELISNSLKYAFPGSSSGTLTIGGCQQPDGTRKLTIQDNGIGMPEGFDWRNAPSLGLRLVVSLVEQIKGTLELKPGEGTAWEITIPPPTS